jgi:hypothetical protein
MIGFIAAVAYLSFAAVTAALVWAMREVADRANTAWRPGTNPHSWRF